jgi:hypothetical protein
MVKAQHSFFIEVDILCVMARTVTLNWENPIGVPGLGVFRHHGHVADFLLVSE